MQDSTNKKREADDDSDSDFIEVLSPPKKPALSSLAAIPAESAANDDDSNDDDAMVVSSTVINPNVDYPHVRLHCGVVAAYSSETASLFCRNCFCHVCDRPAADCTSWAEHCQQKQVFRDKTISTGEVTVLGPSEGAVAFVQNRRPTAMPSAAAMMASMSSTPGMTSGMAAFFMHHYGSSQGGRGMPYYYNSDDDDIFAVGGGRGGLNNTRRGAGKGTESKRITDILAENLALLVRFTDDPNVNQTERKQLSDDDFMRTLRLRYENLQPSPMAAELKMEGDISNLCLHNSFFVEGIRIGWPFSSILTPQRQMAIHIIKGLKRKRHVVLESPTGTGKSAAILCSVLAWQRYHAKCQKANPNKQSLEEGDTRDMGETMKREVPTIIYCSRTHSQVAQMVASLQKTPYRPRMTVLGSRERLCINEDLVKGDKKPSKSLLNQKCRDRKMETDRQRKQLVKSDMYDDNNPVGFETEQGAEDVIDTTDANDDDAENGTRRRKKNPTCPHYQQLSTFRTARAVRERFIKAADETNHCCSGGEGTKLGVTDIEDLASFGKNPDRDSKVSLYRDPPDVGSFGMFIENRPRSEGSQIQSLRPGGAADRDGRIKEGDWILAVNGVSVKHMNMEEVKHQIVNTKKDPLILTVERKGAPTYAANGGSTEDPYSDQAVCPFYLSRALIPSADLIFAPYNYVFDPAIRKSLKLSLAGSVVVVDEAHNVEDVLCESGSGEYSEIDLCTLITILAKYSNQKDKFDTQIDIVGEGGAQKELPTVAHELLMFLEKVVKYMRQERRKFETGAGLKKVKQEHTRFRLQDDHAVEVIYSGPTGFGLKNKAVGCGPELAKLGITAQQCTRMVAFAQSLENHLFGKSDGSADPASEAAMNNLVEILSRFELASKDPEHFFLAINMKPNGNIDWATQMETEEYDSLMNSQRWRKHPKELPYTSPRTQYHPNVPLHVCSHEGCTNKDKSGYLLAQKDAVRHGEMCNGSRPLWDCHLTLRLLSPGLLMNDLSSKCRSVILASGSLAPLPSLCAELNLYGPKEEGGPGTPGKASLSQSSLSSQSAPFVSSPLSQRSTELSPKVKAKELVGRLQLKPKPLEAGHVIDLKKQLLACAIGHFPDGKPLTVSYANYKEDSFFSKLGHALASVIENVPTGGVLVFVPSYSFLNRCMKCWNPTFQQQLYSRGNAQSPEVWARLIKAKGKVIVEPTGSQEKFEAARDEYRDQILKNKRCILLAVFRGKMSEGISFNDDFARAVICVGVPFPSSFDRNIKAKKAYNDEQRKINKNTNLLPGQEWYMQQAYRAIAQALGRCIRHGADYGTVILMDSRHCDDGSPNDGIPSRHKNLPKWMCHTMRTLSMHPTSGLGVDPIVGGYRGLARELQSFFLQAPIQSQSVMSKWKVDLEAAQQRFHKQGNKPVFNGATGQWSLAEVSGNDDTASGTATANAVKMEL